jgi:hypothetical protein
LKTSPIIISYPGICFDLNRVEIAIRTAHQKLLLKVQKPVEGICFVKIFEFYLVTQSLYNAKTILPEKGYVESGGKYFPNLFVIPYTENRKMNCI